MSELETATLKLTATIEAFARTLAERMMPPLRAMGHEFHVVWFELLPWYRRWWHVVTARHELANFVGPPPDQGQRSVA